SSRSPSDKVIGDLNDYSDDIAMPTAPSSSDKSRQTSGNKPSFFSRKIHKNRHQDNPAPPHTANYDISAPTATTSSSNPYVIPDILNAGASAFSSYSSRHSKHGSIYSMEEAAQQEPQTPVALSYDSAHPENRSPVPVEYLPRNSEHNRPQQHSSSSSLSQQYPLPGKQAIYEGKQALHDLHQSVHQSVWNLHSAFKEGGSPLSPSRYPQPPSSSHGHAAYPQHASASSLNSDRRGGGHSSYTTDSSTNTRLSVDQASVLSYGSNTTRGSSSINNTSSIYYDANSNLRPPSHHSNHSGTTTPRMNQSQHFSPVQPSVIYSPPPPTANPQDPTQLFTRPKDDRVVDQMFYDLMIKRGWQNLPEQAKRQMLAYPASKKWTLVHQDRLAQWQGEQKRRHNAKQAHATPGGGTVVDRAEEEGSPEWYVKRVLDDKITAKELQSLSVSLRTQPIR
ncbi:hypothetical protein KEM55_004076, partial [Ascosphaera atra]